ncbi:hypothetical protein ACIBL3_13540 [Kribbella sp. NPDC050124]|uniref:hypothetical protein n=1 Tax=Kribbella sp. NPDC050124 TaxID=3364114 RepID=UPI0037A0A107
MTITQSWRSIDAWLTRHAPATYAVLAPPATDAELAAMDLPPEVVESLRCHNGLTATSNTSTSAPVPPTANSHKTSVNDEVLVPAFRRDG